MSCEHGLVSAFAGQIDLMELEFPAIGERLASCHGLSYWLLGEP